jgi:hypothetical protein
MTHSSGVTYKITHQPSGEWRLHRDGDLVDIEHDPERAPLAEIFLWATRVVFAEDRVAVLNWVQIPEAEGPATYVAEIALPTPRL